MCPTGTTSVHGSTKNTDCICLAGFSTETAGTECTACDVGKYEAPKVLITEDICGPFALYGAMSINIGAGIHINGGDIGTYTTQPNFRKWKIIGCCPHAN